MQTANDTPRRVGVSLEFTGLSIERIGTALHTAPGDFSIELDYAYLKQRALRGSDEGWWGELEHISDDLLGAMAKRLVPFEVACPPIAIADLHRLHPLIAALREAGARGTNEYAIYAWAPGWWCSALAIALAGGRAIRATPHTLHRSTTGVRGPWPSSGGGDIASDLYEASAASDSGADRGRDAFELAAIGQAETSGRPVLGICRGAQLINIVAIHQRLGDKVQKHAPRPNLAPKHYLVSLAT